MTSSNSEVFSDYLWRHNSFNRKNLRYFQQDCLEISLARRSWNYNLPAQSRWHFKHWRLMRSIEIHIFGENKRFQNFRNSVKILYWWRHKYVVIDGNTWKIVRLFESVQVSLDTSLFAVPNLLTVAIISKKIPLGKWGRGRHGNHLQMILMVLTTMAKNLFRS